MINFIFAADLHWKGASPRNRIGDYKKDATEKLLEVFKTAEEKQVQAILIPGDILDTFIVSIPVLLDLVDLINNNNDIPIYTTFGQHDVQGYNKESIYRTCLALLIRLVPKLHLITEPDDATVFTNEANTEYVQVTFSPYSRKMDVQGYGYSPEGIAATMDKLYKIHVAHGTLLDHDPPFDKYTLIDDVVTAADLVLTGDYHPGYGLVKRSDGKIFYNPGSLTRLKASEAEIERRIKIGYIEIENGEAKIEDIYLKCQKPGDEVLDRSKIEEEKARDYAMGQFSTYVESSIGERVILDVNQAVEFIAGQELTEPYIVKAALQIIDENRAKVVG